MSDWKPEPGTFWLDSDGDVWSVDDYGEVWYGARPYLEKPSHVLRRYGPLRRLGLTDEVVGDE